MTADHPEWHTHKASVDSLRFVTLRGYNANRKRLRPMCRFNTLRNNPDGNFVLPYEAVLFLVLLLICLSGCASTVSTRPGAALSHSPSTVAEQSPTSPQTISEVAVSTTESNRQADLERLALLWQRRTREDAALDFP